MCAGVTIVGVEHTGTDDAPEVGLWATCNDPRATDCGFRVKHSITDDDGTEYYVPQDWWIDSEEMDRYTEMHRAHAVESA